MRLPQRSLRSEDGRTAEAALPLGQGSGRLAGRGLAGVFPQGGSGLRLCDVGMDGGAGGRCRKADGMERRLADIVGIRGDCDETNDEMNLIEMQDCIEEKNPYLYMGKKTMR